MQLQMMCRHRASVVPDELEINGEKAVQMVRCHQNAARNCTTEIANKSCEYVADFKYSPRLAGY